MKKKKKKRMDGKIDNHAYLVKKFTKRAYSTFLVIDRNFKPNHTLGMV